MAFIAMLIAAIIWGCTFPLTKHAFGQMSPFNFIFLRFFMSSVAVVPFLIGSKKYYSKMNLKTLYYSLSIGSLTLITILFQGLGLNHTSASLTSFISGCPIIFIFFIKAIMHREVPSRMELICALLCILGLSFITLDGNDVELSLDGIGLIVLGTFAYAASLILWEKASRESIGTVIVFSQNIVCCLFASFYSKESFGLMKNFSLETWFAIFYCSVISSLIAYGLQAYAQKRLDSTSTSMILMLEPVFGSILAYFYLGEDVFNVKFVAGSIIILGSVGYLSYIQKGD